MRKRALLSCIFALLIAINVQANTPVWNSLTMGTDSYFYSQSSQSVYPSVGVALDTSKVSPGFEGRAALEAKLYPGPLTTFSINIPEAYLGTGKKTLPVVQAYFGRKIEAWNALDEQWQLGIWQPRFREDYLNPETVGLTGLFTEIHQPGIEATLLISPAYLPDQGPYESIVNGQVVSNSPWATSPGSTTPVYGVPTPSNYSLVLPSIGRILFMPGINFRTRIGQKEGAWLATGYAYKPMNQVLMAYDSGISTSGIVNITLFPRFLYHHLFSLEGGYRDAHSGFWLSALYEQPVRDQTPSTWATQEVVPSLAVSATAFSGGDGIHAPRAELSFLNQWGGNAPDANSPMPVSGSMFEYRYPFQTAVSVSYKSPFLQPSLGLDTKMIYDISHDGAIVRAEMNYRLRHSWLFAMGADFLITGLTTQPSATANDFINRYQDNDRVHAGVSYVF